MKRRDFLAASSLAGLAPLTAMQPALGRSSQTSRQFIELRKYHMHIGPGQQRLHDFMEQVGIPAFNRIGIEPVGAFTVMYGQNMPSLYVLLPHNSLEAFAGMRARLEADSEYQEAVDTPIAEPNYVRYESQLMRAFEGMPRVEAPASEPRIFELRTYESHNQERAQRKIEMFNKGEIQIFRETNLTPVFFGEKLIGKRLPNLTYMITHENMEARNEHWEAFFNHPGWEELSSDPYYANTVSNVTDIVLQPTDYSQI